MEQLYPQKKLLTLKAKSDHEENIIVRRPPDFNGMIGFQKRSREEASYHQRPEGHTHHKEDQGHNGNVTTEFSKKNSRSCRQIPGLS